MATIKKRNPVWPVVILILLIIVAVYYLGDNNKSNPDDKPSDDLSQNDTISQMNQGIDSDYDKQIIDSTTLYTGNYGNVRREYALANYLQFVDNMDNKSLDKDYYRTAFFKLITAVKREAEITNIDVTSNIASAMENAEKLLNNPTITLKADKANAAAVQVSKGLVSIQQQKFTDLTKEMQAVNTAAMEIDPKSNLSQQETHIDVFFDKSARLLQKMYENESGKR